MKQSIRKMPFHIAVLRNGGQSKTVSGWVCGGIGIYREYPGCYSVTHIWTGFKITEIIANQKRALQLFSEIAALTDWEFLGLEGWKNRDPDLRDKVCAWRSLYAETQDYEGRSKDLPWTNVEENAAGMVMRLVREDGILS